MKLSEAVSFPSANKEITRQAITQEDISPQSNFNLSEKPYGRIVYRGDIPEKWLRTANKRLFWYEENGILNLKYYAGSLKTTWADIENVCSENNTPNRAKLIESILGKNVTCNTKTAVSIFSKLVNDGAIRRGLDGNSL